MNTEEGLELTAKAAYAAGIIDGEGTVGIERKQVKERHSHRVYVCVGNTNADIIEWLHDNFGGNTMYNKDRGDKNNDIHMWQTSSSNAIDFLKFVYPYLIIKKYQAETAFRFQETISTNKQGLNEDVLELRDMYMKVIQLLNKRGK